MDFDDYQTAAVRTSKRNPGFGGWDNTSLMANGLGVAGEAGEVADYIKKVAWHDHPIDKEKLTKELGDVLWYVAVLAWNVGVSLDAVAAANVAKLRARYPDGFDPERSKNRVEGDS